jgi:two-component system OmpR family sensor kinase
VIAVRSLRLRLTLLYTIGGFIVLATLALIASFVIFAYLTRPLAHEFAAAVARTEATVATAPAAEPAAAITAHLIASPQFDGIGVIAVSRDVMASPHLPSSNIDLGSLFGLAPAFVRVRDAGVLVIPDLQKVDATFQTFYFTVALSLAVALVLAVAGARFGARATLLPLTTVTAELKRFAGGDFTPRPLQFADSVEVAELAAAYNGAAQRVTDAFLERRRVEDQIRQFVAEAGHELRTPLTVVAGYVDVLRRGGTADPDIARTAFASLTVEVKRMRTLVERLMTLARLDRVIETQPEVVDVAAIVNQAVEALAVIAPAPIAVDATAELLVLGDPVDLYEAVANLIENALKYGAQTPVAVTIAAAGASILVRVRDGGPGICDADRARIFERFYRGAERGEIAGSGLGLAIAEKAAARLGGTIVLEDGRAGMTTFELTVPALVGLSAPIGEPADRP